MRVSPLLAILALLVSGARVGATEAPPQADTPAGAADRGSAPPSPAVAPVLTPSAVAPAGPSVSAAPDSAAPPAGRSPTIKQFPKLTQPSLMHVYQLGLALLPGVGFRIIAPYKETIDCGQQAKHVCTGLLPFFIDVQPSFGFAQHWDVLIDLRFGIGVDFTQTREFAVAPGVRYWVDPDQPTKFFATIQGVFDATQQNNVAVRDNDFAIRNSNGFMFEVMRNLGFYLQFGETVGFARWMRLEIDGGVGVQARIP